MQILAISGSLRARSSNTSLLQAAALLAPPDVRISLYTGLAELPHFNPDLDNESAPPPVLAWRSAVCSAAALIFSVPEYAHGVPGSLKNALDWLVSGTELTAKPVALLNASPRATFAQASLIETLTVMSARLVPEASITLPLLGQPLSAGEISADPGHSALLRSAIDALAKATRRHGTA